MSLRALISECLLGAPVRYDGGAKPSFAVKRLAERLRRRAGEKGQWLPLVPRSWAALLARGRRQSDAGYGSSRRRALM